VVLYDAYDVDSVTAALAGAEGSAPIEAVINLAGENVARTRWTGTGRRRIRESRVVGTRALVQAIRRLATPPATLLSASAVGYYGGRDPEAACDEDEFNATEFTSGDFLSHVCREWEAAARVAERRGLRVVRLRLGVVLGKGGGALGEMEPIFKMGVGGPIGRGTQIMSWIHVEDAARMIAWALERDDVSGALNVTAPQPVSNKEFSSELGKALRRPAFLPVPVVALRVLKGRIAGMLAMGQTVLPVKALEHGFQFTYPTLATAFHAIYAQPVVV
jgi:uncharacterized protein (TIGR01777 family)